MDALAANTRAQSAVARYEDVLTVWLRRRALGHVRHAKKEPQKVHEGADIFWPLALSMAEVEFWSRSLVSRHEQTGR